MASESPALCAWTVCIIWGLTLVAVRSTPSIDVEPNSYSKTLVFGSATSTDSVSLTCRVSNLGHGQKVAWFKNGRQISENDVLLESDLIDHQRYSLIGNPKYNLYIASLPYLHAFQDSGRYQCRVLNADGSLVIASDEIELTINVIPRDQYPVCNQFVDRQEYQSNGSEYFNRNSVTLECLSDPGKPTTVFMWFRNDIVTPLNIGTYTDTDLSDYQSLNFTLDLSTEETGTQFICQLSQSGQMNRHCTIGPITIYDEPVVNVYAEITRVNSIDSIITFTCSANTSGPSVKNYYWNVENVENGLEIALFEIDYMPGNKTITLSKFQSTDNGEYNVTCILDYGFTFREASARLLVKISSPLPSTTEILSTISTFTPEMTIAVSRHTRFDQYTSEQINTRDVKTTIVHGQPGQQSDDHPKTETVVGAIFGVLMFISLVVIITIVYIRKRPNRKQEDEREMATQGDYANLTADRREESPDKGHTGEDGYANLTVEGRDKSSDSVYTQLNHVDNDSITPMQRMVGEDGYALVNLGRSEDNVQSEYTHLNSLTDKNSVFKRELVGDDGYANLTRRSEGDSEPSYAQLSNVGEESKNTTNTKELSDDSIINK